jgi:hypothetical protein
LLGPRGGRSAALSPSPFLLEVLEETGEPADDGELAQVVVRHGGGGMDANPAQLHQTLTREAAIGESSSSSRTRVA